MYFNSINFFSSLKEKERESGGGEEERERERDKEREVSQMMMDNNCSKSLKLFEYFIKDVKPGFGVEYFY